jgi:DNA-directed RNA polymerase specialized sigma24 family protein
VGEDVTALGDRALVAAMRRDRASAGLAEFYRRFRPVLMVAVRRMGGGGSGGGLNATDSETLVEDTLTDAAVRFIGTTGAVPVSVAGYLVRSLRNRALNEARARGRFAARFEMGRDGDAGGVDGAPAVVGVGDGGTSEYARRASLGADRAESRREAAEPAVARLAAVLRAEMNSEDQLLATWVAHGVTQHQMAEWLAISDAAIGKRIARLRARLHAVAARHLDDVDDRDRRVLATILARADRALARARPNPL